MKYRFIPIQTFSATINMALDEAIMEEVKLGNSLPTIRLYKWDPSAISIGYFQGLEQEVNVSVCAREGVNIIRRQTGGGAVYHEHEITYSVIAPVDYFDKNIIKSYAQICNYIVVALKNIGLDAIFSPINDIHIHGQKISGNAQTRKNGVLLQHGTILVRVDVDKMFSLLKVSAEKRSDKLIASVKKAVTSLDSHNVSEKDFVVAFRNSFTKDNVLVDGDYTEIELKRASELEKEKYSMKEWNYMR